MNYKAAVIGLGVMGCVANGVNGRHPEWYPPCNHADAYLYHPDVCLVAGCSRTSDKREYFHRKYSGTNTYADCRELFDKESIDLVSISTPARCRAEIVLAAAEAGVKRIYCEKAMACSLDECDKMIQVCEANNVMLIINHQRRWDNRFGAIKNFLEEDKIGDLQTIQISFGGGRLCRGGSHMFDLALMFAEDRIESGWGWLSNPTDFDSGGIGVFETNGGIRIVIDGSLGMNHYFQIDLIGERGVIRLLDGGFRTEAWLLPNESEFGLMNQHHLPHSYSKESPMLNAIQNLIHSIENGTQPKSSGFEGRAAFEMIAAIHQSHYDNRATIKFPLRDRTKRIESN